MDVARKHGLLIPVSAEQKRANDEMLTQMVASQRAWQRMTPAQRAAAHVADSANRAEVRAATPVVALTIEALCDRLGWSLEFAQHFIQPYCGCDECDEGGGVYHCDHARDLGLDH